MNPYEMKREFRDLLVFGSRPSEEFEKRLFSQAEELLVRRREKAAEKALFVRRMQSHRSALLQRLSRSLSLLAPPIPSWSAQAAMILILSAVILLLKPRYENVSFSDLYNETAENYEAARLAENEAYEREVRYAHDSTSGGL